MMPAQLVPRAVAMPLESTEMMEGLFEVQETESPLRAAPVPSRNPIRERFFAAPSSSRRPGVASSTSSTEDDGVIVPVLDLALDAPPGSLDERGDLQCLDVALWPPRSDGIGVPDAETNIALAVKVD